MPLRQYSTRLSRITRLPRGRDGKPIIDTSSVTLPAITLHQPWATAVALGLKTMETRSRMTWRTGDVAIHAGLARTPEGRAKFDELKDLLRTVNPVGPVPSPGAAEWMRLDFDRLPFGAIVAVAEIVESVPVQFLTGALKTNPLLHALGDFGPGRFAWDLKNIRPLKQPIPWKGAQGWFTVTIPKHSFAAI